MDVSIHLKSGDMSYMSIYQIEDDFASDGSPGIANFVTSMIEPLEAQGRGFSHGHKKTTGVPASRVAASNFALFPRSLPYV